MDVYVKHKGDFHTLRKRETTSGDCRTCSLRSVCEGREGMPKRIVTALCDAGGHGFKEVHQ